jgi:rare lipoprotein A
MLYRSRRIWVSVLVLTSLAIAGCGHKKRVRQIPVPVVPKPGDTETGTASWYGHPYHGRRAADGEVYDMEKMVAAHRTLPFHTWVRVVNLANDRSVELRIIDRGPFVDGRIIDVSHAAARELAMIGPGTAKVRVEIIRTPVMAEAPTFAVQVGAFRSRENAERVRAGMAARYGDARLVLRPGSTDIWRVLVGSEATPEAAAALSARIQRESGEKSVFVVRLDS